MKETSILIDKPKREKPKTVHTPESTAAVAESVYAAPATSIHRRSQQLNISETSLRRILLFLLVQELKPIKHPMHFRFPEWACDRLTDNADFCKKKISFQIRLILILAGI